MKLTNEQEVFVESTITHAVCKLAAARETCFNVCMDYSIDEPMTESEIDKLFGVAYIMEDIIKQLEEARELL